MGTTNSKRGRRRRWVIVGAAVAAIGLVIFARPAFHIVRAWWSDRNELEPLAEREIDDASRLNRTTVAEVWPVPSDPAAAERELAALLTRARRDGLKVSIAGARHSMGGHTIYPGGIVVDMLPFSHMSLDKEASRLHVGAGALWTDVIEYLDARGMAVAVMQSNSSFSVGGSISVNCHGWQFSRPPICSTVETLRLMKADGTVVRCSRDENAELFGLALGGYGLFGIILDVELRVVPNECYRLKQYLVPLDKALQRYESTIASQPDVQMVYARLNIVPERLFQEAIITAFSPEPDAPIPPLKEPGMVKLRRAIFRGSAESDYGKELRWKAETRLQPHVRGELFSRNQLMNEGVEIFQNRSATSTDILHEYFVPRATVEDFVLAAREIIQNRDANLLNVTVREIKEDTDTFLRYADQEMFAFVMLFHQQRSEAGERQMKRVTGELIDAALAANGRYYLPYRLHASREQFRRAYPQAGEFFARKRRYDPDELFQNEFYVKYGAPVAP